MGELELLAEEVNDALKAGNARLDARLCGAVSSMDFQSVMDCFLDSSDLVVVLYGNLLRGSAAVRRFFTDLLSGVRTANLTINEVTHWNVGETVFGVGTATYEYEAQDGSKSVLKACWTDARQKVSGRWLYILAHAARVLDTN